MVRRHKDRETSRWSELRSALAEMFPKMKQWRQREWIIFFEIETIFHLYERLVPADTNRPAAEAWALVSGYCSGTINTEPEAREMFAAARTPAVHTDRISLEMVAASLVRGVTL